MDRGVRVRDVVGEHLGVGGAEYAALTCGQTGEGLGAGAVQGEDGPGDGHIEPGVVLGADEVHRRALGSTAGRGEHQWRRGGGPRRPATHVKTLGVVCPLVDGTDIEHPDAAQRHVEHADGLADGHHRGVIGPDAAIDRPLPVNCGRREERGCGCGGHGNIDHGNLPVVAQPCVVRRLEQAHFAALHVPRRDDQPLVAVPQQARPEHLPQRLPQHLAGVGVGPGA